MDRLSRFKKHSNEPTGKDPQTSESRLQAKCVEDMRNYYPETRQMFFSIDNNATDGYEGGKKKAEGMEAGVADTCYIDYGRVLWIEFKKPKGGKQAQKQKEFQRKVEERGHKYYLCRDYFVFWQIVGLACPEPYYEFKNTR